MKKGVAQKRPSMGLIIAAITVMAKSSKIIAALKVLKFGKPLITVISMAISAVAYGIWLGPWFGIGLIVMIFIHEMGHVIALRLKGFETKGPVFIPFLGAAIFVPKFEDRETEAFVGYGGPLLGMGAALVAFGLWFATGQTSEILLLVSYLGVFINLFNLIPISPLDGGRISQVIGSWFKWIGLIMLLAYTAYARQPALMIIWILVLDAFSGMPLWMRPSISGLLGICMMVLMLMGYSYQPWWVDVIDCVLATIFTLMFWGLDRKRQMEGIAENADVREYPSNMVRSKWLAYYVGLLLLSSAVIVVQIPYLPHGMKEKSETVVRPPVQIQ
ncbi:hypothetical protein FJY93_01610 [Candidatus Kaiserbacteria bacterium]|nr:hypothetical protein [Candidatus Kaiserbacteria bacterium]